MSIQTYTVPPIDFNLYTGPARLMGGAARQWVPVLDTPYGEVARFMYVGVTGDVTYITPEGKTITLVGLLSGAWHIHYSLEILSAGTTATNIVVAS